MVHTPSQSITVHSFTYCKLESTRKSKGISLTFMAKNLGYKSPSAYKKIEQGQTEIKIKQGLLIAKLLNEDFFTLFFD